MKITWLGQAGLLFEACGKTIIVDPYLSNSCFKLNPKSNRRVPVDERFLKLKPDYIIITHNHLDHLDPETLVHYLGEDTTVTVLAPYNAWTEARKNGGTNNYVMFNPGTEWSDGEVNFRAVKAEHSDLTAIGVMITAEGKTYYASGDTLYNHDIIDGVKATGLDIYAAFIPVNGVGNNMNMQDGARFAREIGAKKVIPVHIGLFDAHTPSEFECEGKVEPKFFEEIKL